MLCKIWDFHDDDYEECRRLRCDADNLEARIASIIRVEKSAS
jgi:hypothetical protein